MKTRFVNELTLGETVINLLLYAAYDIRIS